MTKIIYNPKNQAAPRGPQIDDEAHERLFSEIGPPEIVNVGERRIILFDYNDKPLTRKAGLCRQS